MQAFLYQRLAFLLTSRFAEFRMIPKVEIEAGKADLIREILGVNDLQDINLLDEYRDIFIKSQKSAYKNESVNDINCTD